MEGSGRGLLCQCGASENQDLREGPAVESRTTLTLKTYPNTFRFVPGEDKICCTLCQSLVPAMQSLFQQGLNGCVNVR